MNDNVEINQRHLGSGERDLIKIAKAAEKFALKEQKKERRRREQDQNARAMSEQLSRRAQRSYQRNDNFGRVMPPAPDLSRYPDVIHARTAEEALAIFERRVSAPGVTLQRVDLNKVAGLATREAYIEQIHQENIERVLVHDICQCKRGGAESPCLCHLAGNKRRIQG